MIGYWPSSLFCCFNWPQLPSEIGQYSATLILVNNEHIFFKTIEESYCSWNNGECVGARETLVDNWEATNFKILRARKIKQIRNFRSNHPNFISDVKWIGFGYATCYVFPLHEGIVLKWAGGTTTINSKTQSKNTANKFQCFLQIARASWPMLTDWDSRRLLTVT